MIKSQPLKPGDCIGIASPSYGAAGQFPHRLQQGIDMAERLGFNVRIARHALGVQGHVSGTPQQRADDLHELFADPDVRAIVAAIGGDHSYQLLPLLDFDLIRRNPKIFMGYSDITVLNVAIATATGLVTFNGPAFITDFAEYPSMLPYTQHWMTKILCDPAPAGVIEPAGEWTEEFMDWSRQLDRTRPRQMLPSAGWTWLKPGAAEGRLVGGCIESLQHLRGTRWFPDFQGAIFFFETSEEKPTPETLDGLLMDYENMGVFDRINGLLVGRPMSYTHEEKEQLRQVILERTRRWNFPIITDMDFGHTVPQFPLPIGCMARIDSAKRQFSIIEGAVQA